MRLRGENSGKLGGGVTIAARLPEAIRLGGGGRSALERLAYSTFRIDKKEQAGTSADGNLGVVTGFRQRAIAVEQRGVQLIGTLDGGEQNRRAKIVYFRRRGVKDEKTLGGEDFGVEVRECLGKGAAGAIGGLERFQSVGPADPFGGFVQQRRDGFIEDDGAYGDGCGGLAGVDELFELMTAGEGDVIDLGEVMIFTGKPEDGCVG